MKLLKRYQSLGECDADKAFLESMGIRVVVKNEHGSITAGAGPTGILPFAFPELWIVNDDQYDDAIALLRG